MIEGMIVRCDICGDIKTLKLDEVDRKIIGDTIQILDRYVCNECIARSKIEDAREAV